MSAIKDGGPAFPFVSHGGVHEHQACLPGMTLRDYFAAKAMRAFIREYMDANGRCIGADHPYNNIPHHAYHMADAMLAERESQP